MATLSGHREHVWFRITACASLHTLSIFVLECFTCLVYHMLNCWLVAFVVLQYSSTMYFSLNSSLLLDQKKYLNEICFIGVVV